MSLQEDIVKLELDQAINTYKTMLTLTINVVTILIIGDITLTGYAIRSQSSGLLLLGSMFPIGMLMLKRIVNRLMIPIFITAYCLEQKYGNREDVWLITTFIKFQSEIFITRLEKINSIDDPELRELEIRKKGSAFHLTKGKTILIIISVIAFGQIGIAILLYQFFGWNLF